MTQNFDTTIGLYAGTEGNGQPFDFDGAFVSNVTITNGAGPSIQYSNDGGVTWTTVSSSGTAAPSVPDSTAFYLRKLAPSGSPVPVRLTWKARDSLDPSNVAITGGVIGGVGVLSMGRKGLLRTASGFHNGFLTGATTGHTFQQMFSCPVPFYAVQLLYANSSATDMTVLADRYKCAVAATEQIADRSGAYQGGTKTANWTALTFGGLTYPNLPAASGSNYSYSLSDVAEVPSFAPTDGTSEYKLLARAFKNTAGIQYINTSGAQATLRTLVGSDVYSDDVGAADYTASNPGSLSSADQGLITTFGVVFHTVQRYSTVLAVGDSISAGTGTTAAVVGYPIRAKATLAAAGKAIGVLPTGVAGSTSASYISRAKAVIAAGMQPTFCVFPINTRNDAGGTAPTVQQTQNRISSAIQFAEYLADRGIIPIIVGPTPEASMAAAGVTSYTTLESVGPVIAAAVGGAYVSTLGALSAGASNSYGWASVSDTSDNIHLSDQGAAKVGALVATAMSAYI